MAEQPQGTEYTLQGVMRFLQIEWHNHERARNAWDIERAEMKAKIAKQEGDCRSAKKLNESLDRQIRMLERALKQERAKNKALVSGEEKPAASSSPPTEEEMKKEWNGKIGIKEEPRDSPKPSLQLLDHESEQQESPEAEREAQRDKSKLFLQKCVEELTYLLTPPSHPLPPQPDPQSMQQPGFAGQRDVRPTVEEVYMHQQQQKRNQQSGLSHLPSLPNHHPPPVRAAPEYMNPSHSSSPPPQQAALMSRQAPQQPVHTSVSMSSTEQMSAQGQVPGSRGLDDSVEQVTHSYDTYGRPVQTAEDEVDMARPLLAEDPDGWNFDDATSPLEPQPDIPPSRRPDTDIFPSTTNVTAKSPPRNAHGHRRRSSGSIGMARKRSDGAHELRETKSDPANFKVKFALRGHLDVVRSIIFTGGGSPSEPEICTTGDDGMIKRWILPANYGSNNQQQQGQQGQQLPQQSSANDLDIQSYFTHRGHEGIVTCLAACPASASFSTGGRVIGDGWIFSGGQDATVRVWERGRVDPKATIDGHTDSIWALCVLPAGSASVFGSDALGGSPTSSSGSGDRVLLVSGSADNTVKIWSVSAPPHLSSPQNAPSGSRRGVGGSRRHSITSGSNFPSSPQPSTASMTPFFHTLIHSIDWPGASPTCISPLGTLGESFVVSYADSSVLIFDTKTGEEVVGMASSETYDGTPATGVNSVVVTSTMEGGANMSLSLDSGRVIAEDENVVHGATGSIKGGGIEGVVITGHEDRYVRFFDANSGQCTYSMLAHPASIAALSLSPDGRELVSAGHDGSLRFWSLEKRSCVQEITSHRVMRGEGVVSVIWSQDGRFAVAGGGDGVVKVFAR